MERKGVDIFDHYNVPHKEWDGYGSRKSKKSSDIGQECQIFGRYFEVIFGSYKQVLQ